MQEISGSTIRTAAEASETCQFKMMMANTNIPFNHRTCLFFYLVPSCAVRSRAQSFPLRRFVTIIDIVMWAPGNTYRLHSDSAMKRPFDLAQCWASGIQILSSGGLGR
jgi:hypothetical protein